MIPCPRLRLTLRRCAWTLLGFSLLSASARAQNLVVGYSLPATNTLVQLQTGDPIPFPATTVNASVTATVVISNLGASPGTVNSISTTGAAAFQLVGISFFTPLTLAPNASVSFGVRYTPTQVGADSGNLFVNLSTGALSFRLTGTGVAPALSVSYTLPSQNAAALSNGGTLQFPATTAGTTVTATVAISNASAVAASIDSLASTGAAFQLTGVSFVTPFNLPANTTVTFGVRYAPSQIGSDTGTLSIGLAGTTLNANLAGSGTSAAVKVSYLLPTDQNAVTLVSGGTLAFPSTVVNTSLIATITIANTTTSAASIDSIASTGAAFQLVSVSFATPLTLPANASVSFGVRYIPSQVGTDSGTLSIGISGTVFTATLAGTGVASNFSYAVVTSSGDVAFAPNQTVPIPDTLVGTAKDVVIKVKNTSPTALAINAITPAPAVYTVSNLPPLPAALNPGDTVSFTLTFSPLQAGTATGSLHIGGDAFVLAAVGLGSKLTFTYGTPAVTLLPGGILPFSPAQVGQSSQVSVTITNTGTAAGSIASIAVADTRGVFAVQPQPTLPATLDPGGTLTVTLVFTPATTGFATSTFQVDALSFTLSGAGTAPPPLPAFQFTGASGTVNPMQQPAIGLTLSAPYSLPLTGVLTITTNSTVFAPDPAVVFSTGTKTVAFTIPANSTQAVFTNGAAQILLQSGTTAGTITIAPTFATQSGLDLTPPSAPTVVLTVAASAPNLLKIQLTGVTQATFTVSVSGYTTPHSLSTLTYSFIPSGGGSPSQYVLDVAASAGLWFNSTASQPFGGQFSVAVPFANPNPSTTALATSIIKSVTVTATNAQGTSNAVTLTVQ